MVIKKAVLTKWDKLNDNFYGADLERTTGIMLNTCSYHRAQKVYSSPVYRSSCLLNLTMEENKFIKSNINNLWPEIRQMLLSSKSDNVPVPGVLARWRCIQMHQKPARIHPTLFVGPWPQGFHLRLVFHNNKKPKYQIWQRSECYSSGEGVEKEKCTTKLAKKTKVKDMAKKWKGETTRRKGMETGDRESRDSREGHRKMDWGKRLRCWQSSALSFWFAVTKSSH